MGEKPANPELLDWLASRFVESGWSIKAMHRLMLLSNTYRQSSAITPEKAEKDPANRLWSHFSRRRMDIEEIRDSMLALDGSLTFDGPGRDAQMAKPDASTRRSMYLLVRRANVPTLFNLFDFVDATTSSEGRSQTNVAPQALFMMNSGFVRERSRNLAESLFADIGDDDRSALRRLYLRVLGRPPKQDEVAQAMDYTAAFRGESRRQAWQSYCRILLASNEFLYVD